MLQNTIYYDNVWNVVFDTYGREYPIKDVSGWKCINIDNKKVGVSKLPIRTQIKDFDDVVVNYVFGWHRTHPCPAIGYSVYRKVTNERISMKDYYSKIFLTR
jgi:hypothetical protein